MTAVMKNFTFWQILTQSQTFKNHSEQLNNIQNMILGLKTYFNVRLEKFEKVVKHWNFANDHGREKFHILTKFWLNLKLKKITQNN